MKIYKLVWRFGKEEYVIGTDIANACNEAGIGNGALIALDYWEEVNELPDQLKRFEIVIDDKSDPDIIHNPNFIEQLKSTGFQKGAVTEINLANRKFCFEYVGNSPTGYQYRKVV
ncbi:hypothetical protein NBRC13296_12345 [Paenibacillus chitinolyticus]|uniref:hypothetical protein n=1 Tax=Paenibacillus chitinolyticus TaxID=79263 RepID=UPI0035590CA6